MSKQDLAKKLFDKDLIQKLDQDSFLVKGSNNNSYEVLRTDNQPYDYYCNCPAWKFDKERECKHVLAVLMYLKSNKW